MTFRNVALRPTSAWAAATSSVKSYQSLFCQSDAGSPMALTWVYAASGKNAGSAKLALPVVTASHRSYMALWNGVEAVLGNAVVWWRLPAPGATGSALGGGGRGSSGGPLVRAACGTPSPGPAAGSALVAAARWYGVEGLAAACLVWVPLLQAASARRPASSSAASAGSRLSPRTALSRGVTA